MTEKVDNIVNELKTLSLLEAAELVEKIETTFGVDASTNINSGTMVMAPTETIEEDQHDTTTSWST